MEQRWQRPYRPGLVWQVVWWFDLFFAVPLAAVGVLLVAAGIVAGEVDLEIFGAFIAVCSAIVILAAWRLTHLGAWTAADGVEIRSVMRPARRIPWSSVEGFEVRPGQRLVPFIRPAPQVAIIVREESPVLVPGLWRLSPFTWGGVGPSRIVDELNKSRPHALAPS